MPEEPELQQGQGRAVCVSEQAPHSPAQPQWPQLGGGQNRAGLWGSHSRAPGAGGTLVPKGGFLSNLSVSHICIYQAVIFTIMCEIQGTLTSKILCKVILFLLIHFDLFGYVTNTQKTIKIRFFLLLTKMHIGPIWHM